MTPQVIQFHCTSCHAPLTVPVHLAGVTGPCPKCGSTITSPSAPAPAIAPAPAPAPLPSQPTPSAPEIPLPGPLPAFPSAPAAHPAPSLPQAQVWPQAPAASAPLAPPPAPAESLLPPRRASSPETAPSLLAGFQTNTAPPRQPSPPANPAPSLPSLGGLPPAPASPSDSLLSSLLHSPEPPPASPPAAGPAAAPPLSDPVLGPRLSEIDPSAQLSKRSRKPLPPIPGRPRKGSNLLRLVLAATLLLGCVALIAFAAKDSLTDLYYRHVAPLFVTPEEQPQSSPALADIPADSPKPVPPAPVAPPKQEPVVPVAPVPPPPVASTPNSPSPAPPKPATPATPAPASPAISPLAPFPSDAGPMTPEVVQKAMPALPGDAPPLPAPPMPAPPKAGLMEVPSDSPPLADGASINRAPASLASANDIPTEAKPAAEALLAFLDADTLDAKRKYILGADDPQVNSHIERYYSQFPPAPTPVTTLGFIRHDANPEVGGGMQSVFMVASPDWKYPIPVMVQETKKGLKLDWIAFVEFKDNWLLKFVQAYHPNPGRFHVSIKRSHYFDRDVPDLENKDCFLIQPPQEDFEVAVFVPKKSALAEMLRRELGWSTQFAYVLAEIQWREDGTNQWVELTDVPQLNWYITTESDSKDPPEAKK